MESFLTLGEAKRRARTGDATLHGPQSPRDGREGAAIKMVTFSPQRGQQIVMEGNAME